MLEGANLGADMKNQSMGLMRGVLKSADLTGAISAGADLSRADFEFSTLIDADLTASRPARQRFWAAQT